LRVGGSWFGAKDEGESSSYRCCDALLTIGVDDTNFPIDTSLPFLPRLRLIHVSGSLISPSVLLQSTTSLDHLLVVNCPSFSPSAVHAALAKMRSDPTPLRKLTLPEMGWDNNGGWATGTSEWNEAWKFAVRATAETKGVLLEDGKKVGENGDEDSESESD
jgi:hypothetical protein